MSFQFHIDSSFRNRYLYPNPCDFIVQPEKIYYGQDEQYINPLAISSPNIHSGPDVTKCILGGVPATVVIGFPGAVLSSSITSNDDNIFSESTFMWRRGANDYLFTSISFTDINTPAVGQTTLLLYPPLPGIPVLGDKYNIYKNLPYTIGSLQAGSSTTQLVLSAAPYFANPSSNDELKNMWIMITDTEAATSTSIPSSILGQIYKIVSYNAATRVATVSPNLAVAPVSGVSYEVYRNYKEGTGTLWFSNGVRDKFLTRCRDVRLTSITLPNSFLANTGGGKIDRFPYVIIRIANEGYSASNNATMATNNEAEHDATFIVPIFILLTSQRYFTITASVDKKLKLDFNRPIRITIRNPIGEIIRFAADNEWISTLHPFFASHYPPDLNAVPPVEAVRYPGYTPENPPPLTPSLNQISLILMVDCADEK
jgi:hypothetical protein